MFHVWIINIGIVIISLFIAILLSYELISTRSAVKSKLTSMLLGLGVILILQELLLLGSFMMWSSDSDPMYVYPSLGIAVLSLLGLLIIYLIVKL
ncbi:hypothetical protein [Stygiolobus caldivivus]|uniref:Uncharacterized protein n=1 Tax=Stygiolobus caldivivus TaxID=2824673 RepID=A0A8D5ZIQ5_9CREN|nr:hypothetical protein [Stygiolobus caldivivus]BCU69482.1 hypothetical protein KN1_07790 [Stygiolobus caldivivus]